MVTHILALLAEITAPASAAVAHDPTATALERCLDSAAEASTAGQAACESRAMLAYDRRLNIAYRALIKRLPPTPAQRLRMAQRAWLNFRAADGSARSAFYESRHGTMYVPMQAHAVTEVVRERALQLETICG
jgi:uncharacterized protein YecT (DUF1311 family)